MPRGLGKLQRNLKSLLQRAVDGGRGALTFAQIREVVIADGGGDPRRDRLDPIHERSLKRSLRGLVDRGDVAIFAGKGGQLDPYQYTTVEGPASATGKKN